MGMKIAICIKGLFDFSLESFSNIRKNVFKDLEEKNHELKFFVTSQLSDLNENFSMLSIIQKIKPEKIWLNQDRKNLRGVDAMFNLVPKQLMDCCKIVKEYEQENEYEFDAILIIRMDLLFNKKITEEDIDYQKVNMECMFIPDMNSGDNLFWIPKKYFESTYLAFKKMVEEKNNSHQSWRYLKNENIPLHFIGGETTMRNPEYDIIFKFTRYYI